MTTKKVTQGVCVSVKTHYEAAQSRPLQSEYVFSYRIVIENLSDLTIKLVRRHWRLFDSCSETKEIDGEGVVGQQPVLTPGQKHEYTSSCVLKSEIGRMQGAYLMERQMDGERFRVEIPEFQLTAPMKLS